ncbi:MAG: hypothetical protein ACRD2Z_03775 [Thermoanaerobaculia bacterium]
MPPGLERTAGLARWFQALFEARGQPVPVLVGGGAVELYTGGAYTTGDLDFVGAVSQEVEDDLRSAGFQRTGRHWVHEEGGIFIELPASSLTDGERAVRIGSGDESVLTISPEDALVDRLAAWQHWRSSLDGISAALLYLKVGAELDWKFLREAAGRREATEALDRLPALGKAAPALDALEAWAREYPS